MIMLYYIHGYLSSPESTKGTLLKEKLNAIPINYRDCEPENIMISDCVDRIQNAIQNDAKPTLIGSSLGGLLAVKTANINKEIKHLILLNPAIIPSKVDIRLIQDMPQRILKEMQDKSLFKTKINSKIDILAATMDETVPTDWVIEFAKKQEAFVKFLHDDHSFTKNMQKLPNIINSFINKKINAKNKIPW
jgi:predicted esterase YcpF (UPF0227 family)